jgi:hypothetical protein
MRLVVTLVPVLKCIEFLLVWPWASSSEVLPLGLYWSDLTDLTLASSAFSLFSLLKVPLRLPAIASSAFTRSLSCRFSFLSASLSSLNSSTYFSSYELR